MTRRKKNARHNVDRQAPAVELKPQPPVATAGLRPWLLASMTALFVARPLFPSESAANFGDGLTVVMLWIALGVFWLLGTVGGGKFVLRFGWTDALVLLLVLWHTVVAIWAARHGTPRPAVNMLWEWVGMGLCFFLARQLIVTAREARAVIAVMVALAVAVSGYGLYHRTYELSQTRAKYQADPDRALRDNGLWFAPHSPERKAFEDRLANAEPTATFALTNSLAGFLATWLVVLVGIIFFGGGGNRQQLLGMLPLLALIAACLLWTKSRSGYAAAAVGLVMVWLLGRGRRIHIGWKLPAAAVGVAVVLIAAAMVAGGSELLGRGVKSFGYRLQYWQSSLAMIADHPWLGCGPGNFQQVYTQYKLPEASEEIADPHNFLLEVWATAGTPAALALLGVLGCFAWSVLGAEAKRGEGRRERGESDGGQDQPQPALTLTLSRRERGLSTKSQISNPQFLIPNPFSDGWRHVLLGGAMGFLLSLPLGILGAAPPGIAPVLLGLPLAAATIVALLDWIREGRLPPWLPAVGVTVLLVDLLATGGFGLPGVAGTFWLLLALGLQVTVGGDSSRRWPSGFRRLESPPTWLAWAMLAGAVALAVACYITAYRPVIECQTQLRMAELRVADGELAQAAEHLEAAAAADRLWAEPWERLAALRFEQWKALPSRAAFDRFAAADAASLRRTPNSAPAWAASGDWYSQAAAESKGHAEGVVDNAVGKAVAAYARAVDLYPNSATLRAKLAEAYAAAGDRSASRREAEAALRLDEITPHADKKLSPEMRAKLLQSRR